MRWFRSSRQTVDGCFPSCCAIHATDFPDSIQNWIWFRVIESMCFAMVLFLVVGLSASDGGHLLPGIGRDADMIANCGNVMQVNASPPPGRGGGGIRYPSILPLVSSTQRKTMFAFTSGGGAYRFALNVRWDEVDNLPENRVYCFRCFGRWCFHAPVGYGKSPPDAALNFHPFANAVSEGVANEA